MYQKHPIFEQPENDSEKIWRYMSFTKLVSLIDTRRLYFSRADRLGDPFEGSWPKVNVAAREIIPNEIKDEKVRSSLRAMRQKDGGDWSRLLSRFVSVNCWHMSPHESASMWKLYVSANEGIAIQSTYAKLRDSLIDEIDVFLGVVTYIDYETQSIDGGNFLAPFVHKRLSFKHETEIRAVIPENPINTLPIDFSATPADPGKQIRVDLEKLVEKIYVAPSSPPWFSELTEAAVKRYGYVFEVVPSDLDKRPMF